MQRLALPFAACTLLLVACAQHEAPAEQAADAEIAELRARIAALKDRTLPENSAEEGTQDMQQSYNNMYGSIPPPASTAAQEQPGYARTATSGTRTHTIKSADSDQALAQLDLPAHWRATNTQGGWAVEQPGLKVRQLTGGNFMYASGQLGQLYQQNGGSMRAPLSPEQLVMQDLLPKMRAQGFELVGQQEVPNIAQADQRLTQGLYSTGQQRRSNRANLSTWRKGDTRIAMVLHWYAFETADMTNWGYQLTGLESEGPGFEQEKDGLVNALASTRYNPAYFTAYAQSEQQKERNSWNAHNERMRNNQAAFNAQQQAHRDKVNATNDASMAAWRNKNASMDRQQEATIDGIRGEQNAWNPHNGQVGKVESGYTHYWVNSDGQYYGTNDPQFDPNANGQWVGQWQRMPTRP